MEEKGNIKVSLGVLLFIILIAVIITAVVTYFITKNNITNETKKTSETNTTNSITNTTNTVTNRTQNTTNRIENEVEETGSFNHMEVTSEGYKIDINSSKKGHPVSGSLFTTSFEIENDDETTYNYRVDYEDIHVYPEGTVLDRVPFETIKINDKKFDYTIEEGRTVAHLTYWIPGDDLAEVNITLRGQNCFAKDGTQIKMMAPITEEVLSSKELAGILDFTVEEE